jgi:phosphoribosyl 1,2-cyclic phosphate phosphodiesterase
LKTQKIKIRFLGTGTSQGVPVIACPCAVCNSNNSKDKRLRSSILIEINNKVFTIDAGPDFRYQLLREQVKRLDGILITHNHKDHIAGLDDVRSFNFLSRKPMDIYASARDQNAIKTEFSYAFSNSKYPGVPSFNLHTIADLPFSIGPIKIQPLPALHFSMEVLGFRIGDFAYITDTNYIPPSTLALLFDCKIIVLNALRKEPHVSHYNLEQAINILTFLRPEKAYLTHVSHLLGFHNEVEKDLPDFIRLAYDGLRLEI